MNNRVLIYSFWAQGYQEACQLEAANKYINDGDTVWLITCGTKVGFCNDNHLGCKPACKICKMAQIKRAKKWVSDSLKINSIDDYITKDIEIFANNYRFDYSSLEQLKDVLFEGVEIGYGAISSYVTYTRNIEPNIDNVRSYLDSLLRMEVRSILALKNIISQFKPELIVFHNGRHAHFKPIYGLSVINNIDFVCTESITASDGSIQIDNIPNNIPHDNLCRSQMFKEFYDNYENHEEREKVGKSFFENRRNALFAGDTIYVKDQVKGKMPEGWNSNVENIVIFNSSEDEFFAIGGKYRNEVLYRTQLDGILSIMEHYKNDKTKHFTLRVHPHLKGLSYHYHMGLYELNYPNLTVIPADSDISSYALIDAADKIITFGSTMGIESTYWQKPSICLSFAFYRYLDVVYTPSSEQELWELIETENLPPKNRLNCFPYGFFFMSNKHEEFKYINVGKTYYFNFFGRKRRGFGYYKLFGSVLLYNYFKRIWDYTHIKSPIFASFKKIPL